LKIEGETHRSKNLSYSESVKNKGRLIGAVVQELQSIMGM